MSSSACWRSVRGGSTFWGRRIVSFTWWQAQSSFTFMWTSQVDFHTAFRKRVYVFKMALCDMGVMTSPLRVSVNLSEQLCVSDGVPSLSQHLWQPVETSRELSITEYTHAFKHWWLAYVTCLRSSISAASSTKLSSTSASSSSFSAFSGRTISKSFLGTGRDIRPSRSCSRDSLCCRTQTSLHKQKTEETRGLHDGCNVPSV